MSFSVLKPTQAMRYSSISMCSSSEGHICDSGSTLLLLSLSRLPYMERRSSHPDYENELVHSKHGALEAESEVQGRLRILPSGPVWEQSVTTPRPGQPFSGRTIWIRNFQTPLREFLRTETGGASVLLSAAIAALVWVNVDASSYHALWGTTLSIDLGGAGVALDLRHWVNSGLMAFFFFVLGLEARREFDLGELRERRRFALPLLAGIGGMATAVAIYLAFNMGSSSAHGWGIAMSTDTAFALGLLALVGRRLPDRLRTFILTVVVVDDILALIVIATVYTEQVKVSALLAALGLFGVVLVVRALGVRQGLVYAVLGAATWVALLESGVEPVVVGLAMGLLAYAYPAARSDLERAGDRFREFREQPTPELERSARDELRSAISPNERLQLLYHPWTSYVIVPLFALANAGITIDGSQLEEAKLGILSAALCASIITWLLFRATALLPRRARTHALLGTDEP